MKLKALINRFASDNGNREISMNVLLTFLIKGCAMLISVIIVPSYRVYFNNDDVYGTWLTLSSVFIWINMFDFGIGNGLRNLLAKSRAAGDDKESKKAISSAYMSVGVVSIIFLISGLAVINCLNWNRLMKIGVEAVSLSTFKLFVSVMFAAIVTHFFLLLISSICFAVQKAYLPGLIALITQIMLLIFINIPASGNIEERLASLSGAYMVCYNLPMIVASVIVFSTILKNSKPSFRGFSFTTAKSVMKLGGLFFVIQIFLIALNSSNEIYINIFFHPSDVVQYQYYHKLFYMITVVSTLLLQPIWSAVTKAFYEKRFIWVKKAYITMNGMVLLLCIGALLLAFIYQPIADIWLGEGILNVRIGIALCFAVFTMFYMLSDVTIAFANGMGILKCQLILCIVGAVLKFAVVFIMSKVTDLGWVIVMIANIVAFLPLISIHPLYIRKKIKHFSHDENLSKEGTKL